MSSPGTPAKVVYWHRELPPLEAEVVASDTIEATSQHVQGILNHRDDLWRICYDSLMAQANARLEQEVARRGSHYAHVFDEVIDSRHDDAKNEAWLYGRFDYTLYRHGSPRGKEPVTQGDPGGVWRS
jgi:hypothetical protein